MAIRLNNTVRSSIISAIMNEKFSKMRMEFVIRSDALRDRIVNEVYTPKELKLWAQLPEHWKKRESFRCRAGGYHFGDWTLCYSWRTPKTDKFDAPPVEYNYSVKDEELIQDIQKFCNELKAFTDKLDSVQIEIVSIVHSVSTAEKLIELAPEWEEIIRKNVTLVTKPEKALVPTVQNLMCKIASIVGEKREGCAGEKAVAA